MDEREQLLKRLEDLERAFNSRDLDRHEAAWLMNMLRRLLCSAEDN
jgi:hypothetical protein